MTIEMEKSAAEAPSEGPVEIEIDDLDELEFEDPKTPGAAKRLRHWLNERADTVKNKLAGDPSRRPRSNYKPPASIHAVSGSLYYGADDHWHLVSLLTTVSMYPSLTVDRKKAEQARLAKLLRNLVGYEGMLHVTGEDINTQPIYEAWLDAGMFRPGDAVGRAAHEAMAAQDAQELEARRYKVRSFWLDVKLNFRIPQVSGLKVDETSDEYRAAQKRFGLNNPRYHHPRLIEEASSVADIIADIFTESTLARQRKVLGLIVRSNWRGAPERPMVMFSDKRAVNRSNQLAWLGEGNVLDGINRLTVDYCGEVGHVSYLMLATLPEGGVRRPGLEYLWLTDLKGDPVDVIVRFEVLTAAQVSEEMEKASAALEEHGKQLAKKNAHHGQDEIARTADAIEGYKGFARTKRPSVRFQVVVAAVGQAPSDVARTVAQIIRQGASEDEDDEVVWVVPNGLQLDIHESCIPGNPWKVEDRYVHQGETMVLGAGMPNATAVPPILGGLVGHLTGYDRGPFTYGPEICLELDEATLTILLGTPGAGKSTVMLDTGIRQGRIGTIAILRGGMKGYNANTLDISKIPHPPKITFLDISMEAGGFNPGLMGDTSSECANSMVEFLSLNAKSWNKDSDSELLYQFCLEEVEAHPDDPDFRRVVNVLMAKGDKYADLGRKWLQLRDLAEANICYGTREQMLGVMKNLEPGLTIWSNSKWLLPEPDAPIDDWTVLQRFSNSALRLQLLFTRQLAKERRMRTWLGDDEFHERSQLGSGLGDLIMLSRYGREFGSMYMIGSHSGDAKDIPPEFIKYGTHRIVMRPGDRNAAMEYAQILGLDPNDPEVLDEIEHLGKDEYGHLVRSLKGEAIIRYPDGTIVRGRFTRRNVGEGTFNTNSRDFQRQAMQAAAQTAA